ncbi:MAG: hypothetical protein FWE70_04875, partial [Oscillospiraceae bacterium]|nr:hypothetical protein [Oscillospiraceae bacterium]
MNHVYFHNYENDPYGEAKAREGYGRVAERVAADPASFPFAVGSYEIGLAEFMGPTRFWYVAVLVRGVADGVASDEVGRLIGGSLASMGLAEAGGVWCQEADFGGLREGLGGDNVIHMAYLGPYGYPGPAPAAQGYAAAGGLAAAAYQPQGMPSQPQGMPAQPQGMPAQPQGMPAQHQGMPAQHQGMPAQPQDMPAQPQGMPAQHQG